MRIAAWDDVKPRGVKESGARDVSIRVLIDEDVGAPTFTMRRLEISPGGGTPFHSHPWEHEVYVLSGAGTIRHKEGETGMTEGTFVYVAPEEEHAFVNTGTSPLVFLCMIPAEGLRGRMARREGA